MVPSDKLKGRMPSDSTMYAISDLHLERKLNREALERLPPHPKDWLLLAGDVCEQLELFTWCLDLLAPRWKRIVWVPGNHELWTGRADSPQLRGEAKYRRLVQICRERGVDTPEDPYPVWNGPGSPVRIAPLFLLYDYSFGPEGMTPAEVRAWALEDDIVCTDEYLLFSDPYPSREAWCAARCERTTARLAEAAETMPLILVNHFPLRRDLAHLPLVPRFVPWCGTRRTEDWHVRFRAQVVVTGHLHIRGTAWRDGVRFEEVSLGYPRHWRPERGMESYLRRIWPETS
jgi:3',5'-cyclic AMP phosphodiesterase CpdA